MLLHILHGHLNYFHALTVWPAHDDALTVLVGFQIFLLICGYFIVAALRSYFRLVQELKEKMCSFSFEDYVESLTIPLFWAYLGLPVAGTNENAMSILLEGFVFWFLGPIFWSTL